MSRSLLFVGSGTRALPYFANANGKGIAAFRIDEETGESEALGLTEGIDNPTFLAISPDGRTLCATSEVLGWNEGTISAYAIDAASGTLTYLNKQPTRGDIAAHLGFDRSGRFVAAINYASLPAEARPNQSMVIYPLAPDGEIGAPAAEVRHSGSGPDAGRQERPHAHCVRWTPDNRFVVVADLGIDRLVVYRFDAATGAIARHGEVTMPPGAGPRHFVFHPEKPFAYVANELSSSVASLSFDAEAGRFEVLAVHASAPAGAVRNHCSAIQMAPGGAHLYVGNRGHDSVGHFVIDPATGIATLVETVPAGGRIPRDLAFSPSGRVLAVANQDSDQVALFRFAPASGVLTPLGQPIVTGTPTAIGFHPGR